MKAKQLRDNTEKALTSTHVSEENRIDRLQTTTRAQKIHRCNCAQQFGYYPSSDHVLVVAWWMKFEMVGQMMFLISGLRHLMDIKSNPMLLVYYATVREVIQYLCYPVCVTLP